MGLADFFGREGTDKTVTLKSGDYEVTAAEFVSADAGENKPINQTITLKNDNFVFYPTEIVNVKGITTTDKTLTYTNFTPTEAYPTGGTTFNIEKATMPTSTKKSRWTSSTIMRIPIRSICPRCCRSWKAPGPTAKSSIRSPPRSWPPVITRTVMRRSKTAS